MARTAEVAPQPELDDGPSLDDLLHFVCLCQLDTTGAPLAMPVIANCGWECWEETPGQWGDAPPCRVCLEVGACCGGGAQ